MTPSDRFRQLAHTLVHGLQTVFAGAARRLDAMDQRLAVEPGEEFPVELPEPAVNSDGPPVHWLARVQRSGPPAHWLEDIRRRAANPDRIETFDVTIPSPDDATGQPPDVPNTAETEGSIRSTKPPEGSASNAKVKRGAVAGHRERVEGGVSGAIRRGATQSPEGAASNAEMKRDDVADNRERVEDESSGAIRRGVMQPPHEGSASNAKVKRDAMAGNREQVEDGAGGAIRHRVTHPPEGSAFNAGVKRDGVAGHRERVVDEASGAIRRGEMQPPPEGSASNAKVNNSLVRPPEGSASNAGVNNSPVRPPEGSTSKRRLADMRLLRRTTIGTAARAAPTIVHPVARKPVEVDGGTAERARPQRQAAPDLPRTMAATSRRAARGDSRGSHQPIVAVRRGRMDAPPVGHAKPAEPFEPMAPQPNQWPELPVNVWAEDADSESESRENEHARRLAREQEGIG